jgi:hypothetical protein
MAISSIPAAIVASLLKVNCSLRATPAIEQGVVNIIVNIRSLMVPPELHVDPVVVVAWNMISNVTLQFMSNNQLRYLFLKGRNRSSSGLSRSSGPWLQ